MVTDIINTIGAELCTQGEEQRVVSDNIKYACLHETGQTGWQTSHKSAVLITVIILVLTQLTQLTIANNIGNLIYIKLSLAFDIIILTSGNTLNVSVQVIHD